MRVCERHACVHARVCVCVHTNQAPRHLPAAVSERLGSVATPDYRGAWDILPAERLRLLPVEERPTNAPRASVDDRAVRTGTGRVNDFAACMDGARACVCM